MSLSQEIIRGQHDADLNQLKSAVQQRVKFLRQRDSAAKFQEFAPGDVVVFNSQARPKYLQGREATVQELKRSKIVTVLSEPVGRFPAFVPITTPVSIVDRKTKVSGEAA